MVRANMFDSASGAARMLRAHTDLAGGHIPYLSDRRCTRLGMTPAAAGARPSA